MIHTCPRCGATKKIIDLPGPISLGTGYNYPCGEPIRVYTKVDDMDQILVYDGAETCRWVEDILRTMPEWWDKEVQLACIRIGAKHNNHTVFIYPEVDDDLQQVVHDLGGVIHSLTKAASRDFLRRE